MKKQFKLLVVIFNAMLIIALVFALTGLTSCESADEEREAISTESAPVVTDELRENYAAVEFDSKDVSGENIHESIEEDMDAMETQPAIELNEDETLSFIGNEELRITVDGNIFVLGGKQLWINGTNTPWNNWNDFGGNFNSSWWEEHFAKLHDAGVNAVRVWINCNGDGAIIINSDGIVSGAKEKHWTDLDEFFIIAGKHEIYIMATLTSFDHFKEGNKNYEAWRLMLQNDDAIYSFVNNYTIPFVERYKDNPYLWSIDLCNEPDWIHEESKIDWKYISSFFSRNAAAIHKNSSILVTVGMGFPKYNSDINGNEGNKVSAKYMQSLYDDEMAYIDFWSPHYYAWVGEWYYTPFYKTPAEWGLDSSKPSLIGETAALGSDNYSKTYSDTGWPNKPEPEPKTLTDNYESAYLNGWSGVMPWTSNEVDGCGGFEDLIPATKYMRDNYYKLIFPLNH